MKNRMQKLVARLLGDEHGNILIELALVMPIFATLAMGAYDMSRFAMETSRLDFAARAGAQVVMRDPILIMDLATSGVTAEIVAAATVAAGPDVSDLVVSASRVCWCPDGGGGLATIDCSTLECADGSTTQSELVVLASHTVNPVFTIPGVIESKNIVGLFRVVVQ